MAVARFGDRVRIVNAPETDAAGVAGKIGEVWSESDPALPGVGPVIGHRGGNLAFSVLFEDTEDVVWFAPHLLKRAERATSPPRRLLFVFLGALALAGATALAGIGASRVHRFTLISASTPCLPASNYMTSGNYPNVRGDSKQAARTNIALHRAVITDQRRYARLASRHATADGSGIYETGINQSLTSASTVVVSALIPTIELYPGSNHGQTWISATVDVQSGRTVSLRQLLANPTIALPVLAKDWRDLLRHTTLWSYIGEDTAGYTPSFSHYRYFALTPTGLAFGFAQEPGGSRFAAIIPYHVVRPYLSDLGRRLVAGVRRPRPDRSRGLSEPAWANLQRSSPGAVGWPAACT